MQNVMIWIFPFSALVSVQNIANKIVGRQRKNTTLRKIFASHDSTLCYTFLTLHELFNFTHFPFFFFTLYAVALFLYLAF